MDPRGLVSPTYYVTILYRDYAPDVWRRAVVQGVLEGLVVGTALSTLFTATVASSRGPPAGTGWRCAFCSEPLPASTGAGSSAG